MIKTLQLKNFRQHTDLALSFDQGVTVLRGAKEVHGVRGHRLRAVRRPCHP